ncbi:hypothetical protein GcM1_163001 [Golovinomyces cichoracearum]|uniref:Uncharacterized protein n=1 Tax=Golovinomyces cichoracearum TaxID=62708 RepID=A0A420J8H2_9PEZI|nr:hypothetical protein GcM1_163001 [Golovinomyces cichoracearum]
MEMQIEDEYSHDRLITDFGEIDGAHTVRTLNDQYILHSISSVDFFKEPLAKENESTAFTFDISYSSRIFQGIMPDRVAAGVSTAGNPQFKALQKIDPTVKLLCLC